MYNLTYSELVKLKRAKIWWLFLVAAILPAQLNILIVLTFKMPTTVHNLDDLFFSNLQVLDQPMMQIMLSLLAGHLFGQEYSERTINTLFTYPFSRLQVFFSKLIVLFLLLVVFFVAAYMSALTTAWTFDAEALSLSLLMRYFGFFLLSAVVNFALAPIYALFTLILKNVVSSVLVGIAMMISNGYLVYSPIADWSPLSLPLLLKVTMLGVHDTYLHPLDNPMSAVAGLAVWFVLSFLGSIIYWQKSDVYSGS